MNDNGYAFLTSKKFKYLKKCPFLSPLLGSGFSGRRIPLPSFNPGHNPFIFYSFYSSSGTIIGKLENKSSGVCRFFPGFFFIKINAVFYESPLFSGRIRPPFRNSFHQPGPATRVRMAIAITRSASPMPITSVFPTAKKFRGVSVMIPMPYL